MFLKNTDEAVDLKLYQCVADSNEHAVPSPFLSCR